MRAAIFDLDGTLADTAPDLIGAANDLLATRDLSPLDPTASRAIAGRGGKALIRAGFEKAGAPLSSDAVEALFPLYLELYGARLDRETQLFDGVCETLDGLKACGWRIGVCTNKPERLAMELLTRLGVLDVFAALIGADTLPVRKPDPRPVWETIDRIGGDRAAAVMIGDSQTDLDAARAAEIPVVLTRFGYSTTPVAALKPDAIIDRYDELIPALERLRPLS